MIRIDEETGRGVALSTDCNGRFAKLDPYNGAKLALADQKDGAVDKVVHQCAGCSLGMPGEDKWPLKVQDYTMHFCKQACLDKFQVDPAVAINALVIKN